MTTIVLKVRNLELDEGIWLEKIADIEPEGLVMAEIMVVDKQKWEQEKGAIEVLCRTYSLSQEEIYKRLLKGLKLPHGFWHRRIGRIVVPKEDILEESKQEW